MENQQINSAYNFIYMLTVLFIGLKLCNMIHWSWWWVLSPMWITMAFGIVLIIFSLIIQKFLK